LLCLAAVVEKAGHKVRVLDADSRKGLSDEDVAREIAAFNPDMIGMSCYSIGRSQLIETSRWLRTITPAMQVVGGPHITTFPEDLASVESIGALVYGEGEYTLLDLVRHKMNGKKLSTIPGIVYRENGKTIKTSPRPFIENLDELPYPAYHLLDDIHDYRPMQLLYKYRPVLTLITGRGCPFSCIFCNSVWGRKVRANSPEYIMGMIKKLKADYGVKEIMFYEDTFAIKKARLEALCGLMIQEKLDIKWTCSANVNTLNERLLMKMKEAGCWLMSVGIESGNDEVLKFIEKPAKTADVRNVCAWAAKAGIHVRGFFMLGHPIDTEKTIRQTIDFAKELPLFTVNFCILHLLPGSKVREIAHEYGTVNYNFELSSGHPGESLSFVPKGLTADYLSKMQRRAYAEFFLRPSQIWRLLRSVDTLEDIRKFWELSLAFFSLYIPKNPFRRGGKDAAGGEAGPG
jgi:radical SAM superfamily enzyme YgiQ (UPF0313 family)